MLSGAYEYRVSRLLGLGLVAEHAFGDIDATTVLAVADIHLWRGLAVPLGVGGEFADAEDSPVGRVGALYGVFVSEHVTVAPRGHLDLATEDSLVFGLAIGREL